MAKRLSRREITRAIPVVMMGAALGGMSRLLAACTNEAGGSLKSNNTNPTRNNVPPTDDDEFVPGESTPVDTGDQPPEVPNQVWEARAKQLEDDQARIYGNVFTNNSATNGVMAGKERSHVPVATIETQGTLKRALVVVQHVMGANGLDAGYDAAADAAKEAEAGPADAGDAGDADAARDAAPAVDAGKPPVHYITSIYVRAEVGGKDTVVGLWEFKSDDPAPPSVKFTLPAGVTSITAYEWCTLHGLWKSDPVQVT